jgi:hypothetical protein
VRRRNFIAFLGATAAWPLGARAQQPKLPTIGYLGANTAAAERSRTDALCSGCDYSKVEDKVVKICPRDGIVTLKLTLGYTFGKPILRTLERFVGGRDGGTIGVEAQLAGQAQAWFGEGFGRTGASPALPQFLSSRFSPQRDCSRLWIEKRAGQPRSGYRSWQKAVRGTARADPIQIRASGHTIRVPILCS